MRQTTLLLSLTFLIATALFTACDKEPKEETPEKEPIGSTDTTSTTTVGTGTIINGIMWSTRNIDAPGTFVAKPENLGMLYQFGQSVGWSSTDPIKCSKEGTVWKDLDKVYGDWVDDPSPEGWRLPTTLELQSLCDEEKVTREWTSLNGVSGMKFTDKTNGNSIFLPAAGHRNYYKGELGQVGGTCFYWSRTRNAVSEYSAWGAIYRELGVLPDNSNLCGFGRSLRPVAE